jgi:hypothetical protein
MIPVPFNTLRPHDPRCSVLNTCSAKLYHYTSIETLALILRNKTIRFNRLDRVNDPHEAISSDIECAQSLVFASCWTDSEQESIPLWKLYSDLCGVRISLPTLMFQGMHNNHKVTNDDRLYELTVDGPGITVNRAGKEYSGINTSVVCGPTRMRYVQETQLEKLKILSPYGDFEYDIRTLGTQKRSDWHFENEVRFRILALFGYWTKDSGTIGLSAQSLADSPVITQHLDVPLDGRAIQEMEVVLGPCMNDGQRTIVEALCANFAPTAKFARSKIAVRL